MEDCIDQLSNISRRTILLRLARLMVVSVVVSGFDLTACSQQPSTSSTSTSPSLPLSVGPTLYTYRGHSGIVYAVAWSPDGKRIASGSADATVQVWDAADGSNMYIFQGHSDRVFAVAWSPDGKRIASGSADATVQVWKTA